MSNVLPQETRARIEFLVKTRYIVVGAWVVLGAALIANLTILPAFVSIYFPKVALEETSRELREVEAQAEGDRTTVAKTRALVTELSAVRAEPVATPLIETVLAEKPAGVVIENIAYRPGSLVLAGSSADRRDLEAYRERLSALGTFSSVSIPVAALVGALSGSFTVTLSGSF
jgi:Tfp pilus assembly protein PilN